MTSYRCTFTYFVFLLQNDSLELEGLGSGPAITTNMASILPPPEGTVPEPEAAEPCDSTSKLEHITVPPMEGPVAAAAAEAADEADKDKNYIPGRPFSGDTPPGERPYKYVNILHV
jgi:hypothetical protein